MIRSVKQNKVNSLAVFLFFPTFVYAKRYKAGRTVDIICSSFGCHLSAVGRWSVRKQVPQGDGMTVKENYII